MIVIMIAFAIFATLCLVGVILPCSGDEESTSLTLQATGFAGLTLLQLITMAMMCTVRQNSLSNFQRLPVWFVTIGNIFLLLIVILLFSQAIYLNEHKADPISDEYARIIKYSLIIGLVSPILNWIFLFYVISRISIDSPSRSGSNPNFMEHQSSENFDDDERLALEHHSGEKQVFFEDLRKDYSRPLYNRSSVDSKEKINTSNAQQDMVFRSKSKEHLSGGE